MNRHVFVMHSTKTHEPQHGKMALILYAGSEEALILYAGSEEALILYAGSEEALILYAGSEEAHYENTPIQIY